MEFLAHLLFFLANRGVLLFVFSIFFTIVGVSMASYWRRYYRERTPVDAMARRTAIYLAAGGVYTFIFGSLLFSGVNVFRPHLIDGYLINLVGQQADAVVTNVEPTWNRLNNRTVNKHSIVFKTAAGENVETYFHTWDFNIFPSASSTVYPGQGETFRILYLPSYPTTFLILTASEESPHNRAVICTDLTKALEVAKIKYDFDPKDPKFKTALDEAAKRLIDAKCGASTVDERPF